MRRYIIDRKTEVHQSFDTILTFFNNRVYDDKEMREVNKFKNILQDVYSVRMKLSFKNTIDFLRHIC